MKKIVLLASFFVFQMHSVCNAQLIPNSGFESILTDGNVSNWGFIYLFPIEIDSSGSVTDSMVYDGPFYAPSTDAFSGNYALELRNAMNLTSGQGFAGTAVADDDTSFLGFGTMTLIPISYSPDLFTFYYKFAKAAPADSALGRVVFYDAAANEIGGADFIIADSSASYQYAESPITYFSPDPAAFYSVYFTTTYTLTGYPSPTLGTRLLIDDVDFTGISTILPGIKEQVTLCGNPVRNSIYLNVPFEGIYSANLYSTLGKLLVTMSLTGGKNSIPVQNLPPGNYFLKINSVNGLQTIRVVIN